jgi:hypothetical protein
VTLKALVVLEQYESPDTAGALRSAIERAMWGVATIDS